MDRLIVYRHSGILPFRAMARFASEHPDVRVDFFATRHPNEPYPENMFLHIHRDWSDEAFQSYCYKWNTSMPTGARLVIVDGPTMDWSRFTGRTVAWVKWHQALYLDEWGFFSYPPISDKTVSSELARQFRFFLLILPRFTYETSIGAL
jgi:hypothetical protein